MANNGLVVRFFADTRSAVADIGKLERALGRSATAGEKWQKVGGRMVGAIGVAAAAAGALAVKIGVDGVQAAMAEQAELTRLNKTLENLGFASASEGVNEFIDNLQYAANVADTDLRNAFGVLLRGTKDVTEAQRALQIAVDVSAGSGRDLASVAQAMSRGYLGNTSGLSRLNAGLDRATLKTGDMVDITKKLADTYGGASSAQADTLAGAISGVQLAYDELVEAFGSGIVGSTDDDVEELKKIEAQLRGMQPAAENLGEDVRNAGIGALTFYDRITAFGEAIDSQNWGTAFDMLAAGASGADDEFDRIIRNFRTIDQIIPGVAMNTGGLNYKTEGLARSMDDAAAATGRATDEMNKQKSAADRLKDALDKVNGRGRDVLSSRIALRRMEREGVQGTGGKKGNKVTRDDALSFGLDYASQTESLIMAMQADGAGWKKIAAVLDSRRERLASELAPTLGQKGANRFASQYLATPREVQQRANAAEWRQTMTSVFGGNVTINVTAATPADAVEQAKKWARLSAAGRGLPIRGSGGAR